MTMIYFYTENKTANVSSELVVGVHFDWMDCWTILRLVAASWILYRMIIVLMNGLSNIDRGREVGGTFIVGHISVNTDC